MSVLRPLTLGELLDHTFQLYRSHFVFFAGILALAGLPLFAVQLVMALSSRDPGFDLVMLFSFLGVLLVSFVVGTIAQGATVVAVSQLHLGRPITIAAAFAGIKGRVFELCALAFVVGVLIGLGFLLLIVPGVLLALRWSIVVPAAVLEHKSITDAMSRSADLTKGLRGRVFVMYVLYLLLTIILSSLWQIPAAGATLAAATAGTPPPVWASILEAVGGFVTQTLVGPLLTIGLTLIYYEARVRKEAFDLEHMMAEIDRTPSGALMA